MNGEIMLKYKLPYKAGARNENVVQHHLNIALLNVF